MRAFVMRKLGGGIFFFLSLALLSETTGQTRSPYRLELYRPFGRTFLAEQPQRFTDTVRVLALLIDFQKENPDDPRTSGDGTFQLAPTTARMIDPPPHDSLYFFYKLSFLENYFRKVSNGQLILRGKILGRVTVSKVMSAYTPSGPGSGLKNLADLVIESWQKADSAFAGFPFSSYDAFIVFHAGVGRDINLVSLLGFDPTPNDLPSVFLGLQGMRTALSDPGFTGIAVSGGSFRITNTILLPETETRILSLGGRTDTLHLSMNGLLAASFGSFLGLPDLFDTNTGRSGIGQFGLMDGAGIFAYNGLFPPEPSAWEKIYLGWVTPIDITADSATITLPAVGLTSIGQDTIYKIAISPSEYFLIENRNRDPLGNGQRLTIRENGATTTRTFLSDSSGFRYDNVSRISGSVIDVEDFDWALIGRKELGYDFEGGGVLIWHVDEEIIQSNLASNSVNANINARGVDLEEADGSQDIGQAYEFLQPGDGTQSGSPLDAWFEGNVTQIYKNRFDNTTHPDSRSNSGASTLISIKDFSRRSPRMSAKVAIGDVSMTRLEAFRRTLGGIGNPATISSTSIVVTNGSAVFVFQPNGVSKTVDPSGLLSSSGGAFPVAMTKGASGEDVIVGAQDSTLYIWNATDSDGDGVYNIVTQTTLTLGNITTAPMIIDSVGTKLIVVGGASGSLWKVTLGGTFWSVQNVSSSSITSMVWLPPTGTSAGVVTVSSGGRLYQGSQSVLLSTNSEWLIAGGVNVSGQFIVAVEKGGDRVLAYDRSLTTMLFGKSYPDVAFRSVVVADIDQDGSQDIVCVAPTQLIVLNRLGSPLDGFPVRAPILPHRQAGSQEFSSSVNIVSASAGGTEISVLTTSGSLHVYDSRGRLKAPFPFQISRSGHGSLGYFKTGVNRFGILSVSDSGDVEAWELSRPYDSTAVVWGQHLAKADHTNFNGSLILTPGPTREFFPRDRVYNWPNPVYGSTTQIRFFCSDDARVNVKIFDLNGTTITELHGQAVGGIDSEITWDVSNIGSGIYFARVEAVGVGVSDATIIKIAVVK
ncbi:MAG TPA: T9SS type A sorting domain-containing protein [Bacteroidota bacterium]|nr:T9SS type A sorting domain-containing protein [Bacteroidota bacterium]